MVLIAAVGQGYSHTFGFGGNFDSSSLRLPLDLIGMESIKVKLRYMYGSLFVCVVLLISIAVELILRSLILLFDEKADLPSVDNPHQPIGAD